MAERASDRALVHSRPKKVRMSPKSFVLPSHNRTPDIFFLYLYSIQFCFDYKNFKVGITGFHIDDVS
jgi:hypothetical protein